MLVISAGMQKSGTGWYYGLTAALLATAGGIGVDDLRARSGAVARVLGAHNGHLGPPTARRLAPVARALGPGEHVAVKTHAGPTAALGLLLRTGRARATYCLRDPRDVALSALDAARRPGGGAGPRLAGVADIEAAVAFAGRLVPTWRAWARAPGVLLVRYEDLVADTGAELDRLAAHLGLVLAAGERAAILERHPPGAGGEGPADQHFNRGEAGRFRREMTAGEQARAAAALGPALAEMGYPSD